MCCKYIKKKYCHLQWFLRLLPFLWLSALCGCPRKILESEGGAHRGVTLTFWPVWLACLKALGTGSPRVSFSFVFGWGFPPITFMKVSNKQRLLPPSQMFANVPTWVSSDVLLCIFCFGDFLRFKQFAVRIMFRSVSRGGPSVAPHWVLILTEFWKEGILPVPQ